MKKRNINLLEILFAITFIVLPAHAREAAVNDINANFISEDFDVQVWVDRFEVEGREVFDFRNEIIDAIGLQKGQVVADVGTGTGLFIPLLANKVGTEGTVYAVDISPGFIEYVDIKIEEAGLPQVETVLNGERSVKLPENSVDVMFICDVYHHFTYVEDMLASIHSALRPGGQIIIVDFDMVPGESPPFLLQHVRDTKEVFTAEIEAAGFAMVEDMTLDGFKQTFMRKFIKQ